MRSSFSSDTQKYFINLRSTEFRQIKSRYYEGICSDNTYNLIFISLSFFLVCQRIKIQHKILILKWKHDVKLTTKKN